MKKGDGDGRGNGGIAANDNGGSEARVASAVRTLARLIGRQIAREEFNRLCAANDNAPSGKSGDRQQET